MMQPAKKEHAKPEAVEQASTMLVAQVSWCAYAWNATPQEAAQRVVSDLFNLLASGGAVPVRVEGSDGMECELEVRVR